MRLFIASTGFFSIVIIGLEGLGEFGDDRYFSDGLLEDIQNVLRVKSVSFGLVEKCDEFFTHLIDLII